MKMDLALRDHVEIDDKKMGEQNVTPYIMDSLGRKQYPIFINESGLYALIFGSKLESAKRFKHWVTSEVLPSIRKTGYYEMPKLKEQSERLASVNNAVKILTPMLAKRIGMPSATLYKRLHEPDTFRRGEMKRICKALKIPEDERGGLLG